jgi:hypothetical protein
MIYCLNASPKLAGFLLGGNMTQNKLKEIITYDPKTGFIKWRKPGKWAKPINVTDGCIKPNRYISLKIEGKNYLAHRLAFLFMTGKFPKNEIDHCNGNPSDNRWANLRPATRQENRFNIKAKGFTFIEGRNRYRAQIGINGEQINLGYFKTKEEAHAAYLKAKPKYHGKEFLNRVLV